MSVRPRAGYRVGARKVDAELFMPDIGDWEQTNVIHDFGDGWLICEDRTEYDRRLNAHLTLTCVGELSKFCVPFDREQYHRALVAKWCQVYDTPYYRESFKRKKKCVRAFSGFKTFQAWLDAQVDKNVKSEGQYKKDPFYKILHLRDPDGRPRCCILACLMDAIENPVKYGAHSYLDSNDLGQKNGLDIAGEGVFRILEARIGTGTSAPKLAEEYVIRWYKEATGSWDEEAYQEHKGSRTFWDAYVPQEARDDLMRFRLSAPAPALA